jgi:hypothetical protein
MKVRLRDFFVELVEKEKSPIAKNAPNNLSQYSKNFLRTSYEHYFVSGALSQKQFDIFSLTFFI